MRETFLDNEIKDDTYPRGSLGHFQRPHLGRFPHELSSVIFMGRVNTNSKPFLSAAELDGGLDGYIWNICFENGGPTFVLKLVRLPQEATARLPTLCQFISR